jgi:hypothetical protein
MSMNEADLAFLSRRARLVRWWPMAGIAALVIVLGVFASLFFFEPFLTNPLVIFARLNNDEISVANLSLMASFVPILFCALMVVVIFMLFFAAKSFSTEKRYLALIEKGKGTENSMR